MLKLVKVVPGIIAFNARRYVTPRRDNNTRNAYKIKFLRSHRPGSFQIQVRRKSVIMFIKEIVTSADVLNSILGFRNQMLVMV